MLLFWMPRVPLLRYFFRHCCLSSCQQFLWTRGCFARFAGCDEGLLARNPPPTSSIAAEETESNWMMADSSWCFTLVAQWDSCYKTECGFTCRRYGLHHRGGSEEDDVDPAMFLVTKKCICLSLFAREHFNLICLKVDAMPLGFQLSSPKADFELYELSSPTENSSSMPYQVQV